MRKYTIEQIDEIIEERGWEVTTCNNERNGEYEFGTDTLQVQEEEHGDYFGEFVGDEENGYEFNFYTN
jgi:hypothetical protein